MRCYSEKNPEKIKKAIIKLNLETTKELGPYGSGSLQKVQDGVKVMGGYLVKDKKKVIGWAVAFGQFGRSPQQTHLFIEPSYRKNGLGSRLIKRAKKDFPKHKFVPWNSYTREFFTKQKAPTIR